MSVDVPTLVRLYVDEGWSIVRCADHFSCSGGWIHRLLQREGVNTSARLGSGRRGKSKGGFTRADGYVVVYAPEHHEAKSTRPYVFEHRLVMERHLGRPLARSEVVHHINGIRNDNRVENLQVFASNGEHLRYEVCKGKWSRDYRSCLRCGTTERRHHAKGLCHNCYNGAI